MYIPTRWNVDMRYSRFFALGGGRRFEVQAEFKNIFNIEQISGVNNTLTVDVDGYPVDPVTLVRLPLDSISHSGVRLRRRRAAASSASSSWGSSSISRGHGERDREHGEERTREDMTPRRCLARARGAGGRPPYAPRRCGAGPKRGGGAPRP